MSLSYKPLWDMLDKLEVSKMEFARKVEISNATLAKFSRNEAVTLTTIDKICKEFDCNIGNIVEYVSDNEVQYIPDDSPLEVGTIVRASSIPLHPYFETPSNRKHSTIYHYQLVLKCTILQQPKTTSSGRNFYQYHVVPITSSSGPSSVLDYYCTHIPIKNSFQFGYFQFAKLGLATSQSIYSIVGKLHLNDLTNCLKIFNNLMPLLNTVNDCLNNSIF